MRYLVLLGSIVLQVCLGGLYAWSSFVPSLQADHGLSTTQTQLVFGVLIATFTVSMVLAGRRLEALGPRVLAGAGGVLFGAGYLIASWSGGSFPLLLLGIGIVTGVGTGFGYVCPLATCVKWFPEHKGLVTGVAVAGFGGGAVLQSNLVELLFARGMGVLTVFRWIGVSYGLVVVISALLLRFPEAEPPDPSSPPPPPGEVGELRTDPFFWALVVAMFGGTFAGLMVIGKLSPLVQSHDLSPAMAAAAVSALAMGNALGRISWGWMTDRMGQRAIPASLGFLALSVGLLMLVSSPAGVIGASALIGFGFGASFVVHAAEVGARYGAHRFGTVYPLVFLAYGVSGISGPWAGGWLYDVTGTYMAGMGLSLGVVLLALLGSTWLLRMAPPENPPSPAP